MGDSLDVAFVSNVVYPFVKGGAEKRIHEIGRRLAADGHEVTVYGRHFWDGPAEHSHQGMTLRGVSPPRELYAGERRSITEALQFSKDLCVPLRRHIDDHDLVVASVFPYFPVLAARGSTLFDDTPLVTTWHEVWGPYWEQYLGSLAPFGKLIERLTTRVAQFPVAVSGITADRLAGFGLHRNSIEVVPNGIDFDEIHSTPGVDDGFDVLFAGRLIADKNVDLLLRAFDQVADEYDCTLGIIGDGPERQSLQSLAGTLDNRDRVDFLGFLEEYEDVIAHMHGAEVFVSPSTREGFGITFAEAMAADCTVVAARHPESAASEVIGEAGYLTDAEVASVATAIARALDGNRPGDDPVDRAKQFDWDRIATRAETVYADAVARQ